MQVADWRRDPIVIVLFGLIVIFALVAWAVLLLGRDGQSIDSTTTVGPVLPVVTNQGQPNSLQASPLPLQSGTTAGQSDGNATRQLQPQTQLSPEQLNSLQ